MQYILRVDLNRGVTEKTPAPEDLALLGGRALISALAQKEIDPGCHPLGESNVLILAPGLLSGTRCPHHRAAFRGRQEPPYRRDKGG